MEFSLIIWVAVKTVIFHVAKSDRRGLHYISTEVVYRLLIANVVGSLLSYALISALGPEFHARSIYLLDLLLSLLGTGGLRAAVWIAVESMTGQSDSHGKRIFIYGAGSGGLAVLREIRNNPRLKYRICGFLDDDPSKSGLHIGGVSVYRGGEKLKSLIAEHNVEMVLIAIPSANGSEMAQILASCHTAGVECKTVPGLAEVMEGQALTGQIREVAVEDLLGRTPVHLEEQVIRNEIKDKVVLVTGAAGSIGSELCRQIARFHPAGIVGLDNAETPLFEIDREMKQVFPHVAFYPEIGSVQNRGRVSSLITRYKPVTIFHAAAYKHVPLMEEHAFEAIENNVFGTFNVALAASELGVNSFIMISTDKAVHPTNIMGASKRIAEQILLAMQNGRTQYIAVRFGNVLGSNGSVVRTFKSQIAAGGPVTVTHPEMRRFFMTIPEACQLVLQASAIGRGGQICVLDMGQPVKIIDLARNLISLSGLKPEVDIKIEFTGVRAGEKLYEELSTLLEDTVPTSHEKVRVFLGTVPELDVLTWLERVRNICESGDLGRLVVAIKEIVPEYNPSTHVLSRAVAMNEASNGQSYLSPAQTS
jgi:FlaA1/EpsC-like NDP-sugar epimerase